MLVHETQANLKLHTDCYLNKGEKLLKVIYLYILKRKLFRCWIKDSPVPVYNRGNVSS